MIQELLGGAGIIGEDRKFSINSALESSPSPSSSTITATAAASAAAAIPANSSASAENQNLRCPRCNSSNTKFCYYNNYNLTQPRHFCKTCRRYWTKGGALRNVPIGGGCRKNKNISVTSAAKSSPGRLKNISAELGGKAGGLVGGFDRELPSNPAALWASPQNSQFLALLRATQNQNPNPNPNPISVKEETVMIGSHLTSNPMGRTLGLDLFNQDPGSFFWRNNQHQAQQQQQQNHHHHHHHHQHHQQQSGFILGEVQNTQEIYQRLRSTPNYYNPDHSPLLLSNAASSSSSPILESAPASATELGYWNPALPWSDLPTSNGAYP